MKIENLTIFIFFLCQWVYYYEVKMNGKKWWRKLTVKLSLNLTVSNKLHYLSLIPCVTTFSRLNEVEDFSSLSFKPNQEEHCDILVEKPTFFMKLDAGLCIFHLTPVKPGLYLGHNVTVAEW